jgi:hypothetical protein
MWQQFQQASMFTGATSGGESEAEPRQMAKNALHDLDQDCVRRRRSIRNWRDIVSFLNWLDFMAGVKLNELYQRSTGGVERELLGDLGLLVAKHKSATLGIPLEDALMILAKHQN